jgi:sugar phosphate isomerase/epimerase
MPTPSNTHGTDNLPIAYCANVHPGETFDQAQANLAKIASAVRKRLGRPIGVGLWLPAQAVDQLKDDPARFDELKSLLHEEQIVVYTMNAFPFGNFHASRVKENVYLPDWTTLEREEYTVQVAILLAELLPAGVDGSISTMPCAFVRHHPMDKDTSIYRPRLASTARRLARLREETGKTIRLAIEPEPACVLETTDQAIRFFQCLWRSAETSQDETDLREHLGLCYDVCHQAVEYESIGDSLARINQAGVRVVKMQLSSALELDEPTDDLAREELARFAEPRYLHQTFGKHPGGRLLTLLDLTADHARDPNADWLDCRSWRIHFHVPIHRQRVGRLKTTQPELVESLLSLPLLDHSPHLEVETYTWNVRPPEGEEPLAVDLVEGLSAELEWVQATKISLKDSHA